MCAHKISIYSSLKDTEIFTFAVTKKVVNKQNPASIFFNYQSANQDIASQKVQ